METLLYYFTGTGNSLKVARDLAEELGSTKLVPIASMVNRDSISVSVDKIGIVCPVYMWGLPLIIPEFIKRLILDRSQYIFGIVTYGGLPAATLKQLNRHFNQKGLQLSAGFSVRMPGNYTPLYGAFPEEKQKKLFSKETERIKQIAKIIRQGRSSSIETSFLLANLVFSGLIHKLGSPRIPQMDKEFWINERCTSCEICAQVCPVNNIEMNEGRPVWQHHCQQCLACLHWCPNEAIEFGKNTPGRKRYRHPEIKISEIIRQSNKEKPE